MTTSYYWATAAGVLGVLLILAAVVLSLLGMFGRDPQEPLPRFAGWAFSCMIGGAMSFIGCLLLMVVGAT